MELTYPRFIHSEFMTHRMFSRNASSSRAVPVQKNIDAVKETPAMPVHWGKNQAGMQAADEIEHKELAETYWKMASRTAADAAEVMSNVLGLHKQVVNRVLEPFLDIKVIVTATEWYNFFKLRHHDDAQPEIHQLAIEMMDALMNSTPTLLQAGEYHLPYVRSDEASLNLERAIKCSVARCARVSYMTHDNKTPDIEKDIALADRLLEDGHMSPHEHQATPMQDTNQWRNGVTHMDREGSFWSGNFKSWIQHRQLIGNE